MSSQPKAMGEPDPTWWEISLAFFGLAVFSILIGLLLSIPHPLALMLAKVLE